MRFFIVDDDDAIRSMISEIIEDYDLGEVVGEAENGSIINDQMLNSMKVDILIIDFLMPIRDGIETLRELGNSFRGKVIMVSQVEDKELIGSAYSLGVQYYITKPVNRLEVIGVVEKVIEQIRLQKSITDIQNALNILEVGRIKDKSFYDVSQKSIVSSAQFLLTELGIVGESGSKDLIDMLKYLNELEKTKSLDDEFPALKNIFTNIAIAKLGHFSETSAIQKEIKASEQRVRRAIFQGLIHLASLGLTDYSNPKFEEYATKFFDFTEVRKVMRELQNYVKPSMSNAHINIKKFLKVLYLESKKGI